MVVNTDHYLPGDEAAWLKDRLVIRWFFSQMLIGLKQFNSKVLNAKFVNNDYVGDCEITIGDEVTRDRSVQRKSLANRYADEEMTQLQRGYLINHLKWRTLFSSQELFRQKGTKWHSDRVVQVKKLKRQGSICETRKGPNRTPVRRDMDCLVYTHVLEITTVKLYGRFWPTSCDQIWPKLSKGTSENQDLLFQPIYFQISSTFRSQVLVCTSSCFEIRYFCIAKFSSGLHSGKYSKGQMNMSYQEF